MKQSILNRIKSGKEIVAEIPHPVAGFRTWVYATKAGASSIGAFAASAPPDHQFEATVWEQPRYSDPLSFYEEDNTLLELHTADSIEELLQILGRLVPTTDLFDVPWRVDVP